MAKKRLQVKGLLAMLILAGLLMGFDLVLEKDTLSRGRMNIKTPTGEIKGYMRRDTLQPQRINIYDKHGNLIGYWQQDTLSPKRWIFQLGP